MPVPTVGYVDEIQTMMYAAGDCRRPLTESAAIVEEIIFKQMIWFIHRAQTACESRGEQYLDAEDLIFTLRAHPTLLSRIIQKLKAKDFSLQTAKSDDADVPVVAAAVEDGDEDEDKEETPAIGAIAEEKGRRLKFCKKVLEKIDPTGQLMLTVFDEAGDPGKAERLRRIAAYTASMDADEYVRFSEARQVSFTKSLPNAPFARTGPGGCASVRKLREWLFGSDPFFANSNYKPTPITMEILNILAYETLATIMDCAFLVKQESALAGFGSRAGAGNGKAEDEDFSGYAMSRVSPLIATSTSQQVAALLAQKLRSKPQNRDVRFGIDRFVHEAVQPWEVREAVRRLRFEHGNSPHTLFQSGDSASMSRVIF